MYDAQVIEAFGSPDVHKFVPEPKQLAPVLGGTNLQPVFMKALQVARVETGSTFRQGLTMQVPLPEVVKHITQGCWAGVRLLFT